MKKYIFSLIIGLVFITFTSTVSAKVTSIVVDITTNTITFTYESDVINNTTDVLVNINGVLLHDLKLKNSGTAKYEIKYKLEKGVLLKVCTYKKNIKCTIEEFRITNPVHAYYYKI